MRNLTGVSRTRTAWLVTAVMVSIGTSAWADACKGPPERTDITFMADWLPTTSTQGGFWQAKLKGYYEEAGLNVEIVAPANPADPIKLVARQRVDFALSYTPEIMIARDTGIPVIAIGSSARNLVSGLVALPESGITKAADFKGKTLGVGAQLQATSFTATALASGGLTKDDVKIVDPGYSATQLLVEGKVDAVYGLSYFEQLVADMIRQKEGKAPVVFLNYRDLGVPPLYYQLVVANEDFLASHPNTACHFLDASKRGILDWVKDGDLVTKYVAEQEDYFTLEQHQRSYEMARNDWLAADGSVFTMEEEPWKLGQDWALKYGLITVGSDPKSYFTNAYIP